MTKYEVEVEREKIVKQTESEEFIICDSCDSEVELGEEIRFYAAHDNIDAIDLCRSCLNDSPTSISKTASADLLDGRRGKSETQITDKLVLIIITTFSIGVFIGSVLL